MLHDLDRTLEKLIYERGKLKKSEIDIAFEQPTGEWSAGLGRPTINCWCFDLRENVKLRNMEMNVQRNGRQARVSLPPMRIDVAYLVTAWANRPEDEHRLLWRALGALAGIPILRPENCEGALREQPYDMPLKVAQTPEGISGMSDLWSVLDNQMRTGFIASATMALDTERGFDAPLVFEAEVGIGQTSRPQDRVLDGKPDMVITFNAGESDDSAEEE